jgi:phosphopantetheine attachment domain protein
LRRVGIDDDFIRIGGDLLTAVHLANSIQREMPARISIRDVFGHSTARQLPDRRGQRRNRRRRKRARSSFCPVF